MKDPQVVHVLGQLADIMLGKFIVPKYSDLGSLIVGIIINGIQVKNALIDLGVAINVMKKDTIQHLQITNLRSTPIVMKLANSSTIKQYGMVEDLVITLDSWEYLTNFMILSPIAILRGYTIILGRPWLATWMSIIGYDYLKWFDHKETFPISSYVASI